MYDDENLTDENKEIRREADPEESLGSEGETGQVFSASGETAGQDVAGEREASGGNRASVSGTYPSCHDAPRERREDPPVRKKKSHGVLKTVALILCCALVSALVGGGTAALVSKNSAGAVSDSETQVQVSDRVNEPVAVVPVEASGEELSAAQVYAQNVNATVGINTTITTNYFGFTTTSAASGSGFILTEDGYVLTCYHVVEDSSSITVTDYDGNVYQAVLVGYDESNDIAVLKIDAEGLETVVLGSSDALNVGDGVVAIGNPLGELTFSLTSGVVSALNRSVTLSTNVTMNLIQTDCAINSGNSGGALFNMYGEVVGIVNAKYSSSSSSSEASIDNIGFAIPISQVDSIVYSIIETGTYEKPYIGVTVTDMTMSAAAASGQTSGAVIQSVTEGSPAEAAGLQEGDVVIAADGAAITGSSDLVSAVQALAVGDQITLTVVRSGETMDIVVTVGAQMQSALPEETQAETQSDDSYWYTFPWGNSTTPGSGSGRSGS